MNAKNNDSVYKWLALFVVVIGTFMAILDSSIVNIAIPKLMAVFGVSLDEIKWVLTAYTLALGAIIPLTGFLSDIFGTKKVYMFALASFTLGSLLCGVAWSNTSMIVFRIIQAIGGGMIMPVGMSIIFQIFPPEERGTALGFWGIASMAAPAIGPTLGGYIIQYLDWRLIFNVNVPVGIFGVIMAGLLLRPSETKPYAGFDYVGFISSSIGLVCILYVLGEGSSIDWGDIKNPILMLTGIMSLILFVLNELMHPNPLLELRVLKVYNFTLSQIITCFTTLAMMGGIYVLPLYLQNIRGYTAMQTGMTLFPAAIASGVMMPISGALAQRFGVKLVTIPGLILTGYCSYELSLLDLNTSRETVMWLASIRGLGMGMSMMPINTLGINGIPNQLISKASALSNTIRQVAASLSVTIMTTLIQDQLNVKYAEYAGQFTAFNHPSTYLLSALKSLYMQSGLPQMEAQSAAVSSIAGLVQRQAYIDGMDYAIAVTSVMVIVSIALVLMMRENIILPVKTKKTKEEANGNEPGLVACTD